MSEERIEGTANKVGGRLQEGFGRLSGDWKTQAEGNLRRFKGVALDQFGRAVNALETQVDRAPQSVQPAARRALGVARERPIATMAGLAALTFLLARRAGRRRG
jgi:uncharacterized protein YjbJ (UPF0337 family)